MKKVIQLISFAIILMMGGMTLVSCDPCTGVVCVDGACSNGTCLCNDGYRKELQKCVAFNLDFVGENLVASQLVVDTSANTNVTQNLVYTIVADENDPYKFTLNNFNNIANNHITFTINKSNSAVMVAETITTPAANTYQISGAKTSTQLQVKIEAAPITWTVKIVL